jgi:hypothetical protein
VDLAPYLREFKNYKKFFECSLSIPLNYVGKQSKTAALCVYSRSNPLKQDGPAVKKKIGIAKLH